MKIAQQKLKNYWAKAFPDINDEWPYWWIEGDNYCLAIIDGNNLAAAVDIVEDNWERYNSIKVFKAKRVDEDIFRKDRQSDEISDRESSRNRLKEYEEDIRE